MKLIFAGTPDFAAKALRSVTEAGHEVALTLTQPDRRSGRGMAEKPSPVKQLAQALGIPVFQPETLKDAEVQAVVRRVDADAMVVAAYGLILPRAMLDMPRFGCVNIHASLLPRWRGAAPIQRAILAGDLETGVSIMQMDAGLDTGPVLLSGRLPMDGAETSATLHDKLARLGGQLIVQALDRMPLAGRPQTDEGACYAGRIDKSEARLDWRRPAAELCRQIRAFNPFPGANFISRGETIKVWQARVMPVQSEKPGTVLEAGGEGIVVACGTDALSLLELQKAGGRRMNAGAYLSGNRVLPILPQA